MVSRSIEQQLHAELDRLDEQKQQRVLEYARRLSSWPRPLRVEDFEQFAGQFDPEDLNQMERAIEEDCERIDPDEW